MVAWALVGIVAAPGAADAAIITNASILPSPPRTVGSGNGTLDLIVFTESAGGTQNSAGSFDADNANTNMPTGNTQSTANVTYVTSIGELRDFYILNFPNGSGGSNVTNIAIFVDVNETGAPQDISLDKLDIITNYNAFTPAGNPLNNPFGNDINSGQQNGIGTGYSGGTVQASLDAGGKMLALNNQGAGYADHVIFTGINPFDPSFSPSTRILFHWESSIHDNGGETIFLSGLVAPSDVVPEPASAVTLVLAGAFGLAARRRRRRV
jgi:hypothetical protein